jgi:lysozyme family protein
MQAIPARVRSYIDALIQREGGYVNDPNDRGGPTKFGIKLGTLHDWRGTPVGAGDVAALTVAQVTEIYADRYFFKPGFDAVSDPGLQEFLFDFGVNSGQGTAVMALQRVVGAHPDGSFGPLSKKALAAVTNAAALFFAVKCERYELLLRDVGNRPADAVYAVGWANRLDQFPGQFS